MGRVGPPFGRESSGFTCGFETEGVAASVHLLWHEPEGFARTVQRYGGGGFTVARGDAVETVDVEAQRVAAPVDDDLAFRRRPFRCVEHSVSAVGNAPDKRLPFVAELHFPGLPAFAAFLPRNADPGIADARTVSEEGQRAEEGEYAERFFHRCGCSGLWLTSSRVGTACLRVR